MVDVIVIGAGISGCTAAYELAKRGASVLVLEAGADIACGTTKANSAIVHSGYDPENGTLMAHYNVLGNRLIKKLAAEWNIPYKEVGSLTVAFGEEQYQTLHLLLKRGQKNGVQGLKIISAEEVYHKEPHLAEGVSGALFAPTCGIVGPWEMAISYAENARLLGAHFQFNNKVIGIQKNENGFLVKTETNTFESAVILNAAGIFADDVHNLIGEKSYTITPIKGEYYLLDAAVEEVVQHTIFTLPSEKGKGVILSPAVLGNMIVGPSADVMSSKDDTGSTMLGLEEVAEAAKKLMPCINLRASIRNFSGLRAQSDNSDFTLGEREDIQGFFEMAGIKSPGLTAAPAFAIDIAKQIMGKIGKTIAPEVNKIYQYPTAFKDLPKKQQEELIQKDERYGHVICRCEAVTEGEIVEALRSPLTPPTIGAVKRRCKAGLGRCQGGFCMPRVQEIIARERNIPFESVELENKGSYVVYGKLKNNISVKGDG